MTAPEIDLRVDEKSRLRLSEQLSLLTLPPAKRRRLMNGIAKDVRLDARRNIRSQRTILGRAMEPRKDKRKRRKLLQGLGKGLTTVHKGDLHAEVTWKNPVPARIAHQHQFGTPEKWTASKARKVRGQPNYAAPATSAQAKALIAEGFKRRVARKHGKGKGAALKRVSQKWIRENLKLGQAGLILRLMRTGKPKGKQSWTVKVPARPILGATVDKADEYMTRLAQQWLREMNA